MAIVYNIEEDVLFQDGMEKGKGVGMEQAMAIIDGLRAGESHETLAKRYNVTVDQIAQIKSRL